MDQPTDLQKQQFINHCNARRHGWAGFHKSTRKATERLLRNLADQQTEDPALTRRTSP